MAPAARPAASPRPDIVRLVAELSGADLTPPATTLAERLGDWLAWTDAIALSASLAEADADAPAEATAAPAGAAAQRCQQARQALVRTQAAAAALPLSPEVEPADLRRHVVARQRAMESAVAALRAQVRSALAASSPALRRLALLDAALEGALTGRERVSLALLPSLLERRWSRERSALGAAGCQPVADELQALLGAELELRLQPVDGLIEALRTSSVPTP